MNGRLVPPALRDLGALAALAPLALCFGAPGAVFGQAREAVLETLRAGAEWSVTVNTRTAQVRLTGVEIDTLSTGALGAARGRIVLEGGGGSFTAMRAGRRTLEVVLEIELASDPVRSCSGVFAQGGRMMAGVCGERGGQGAWYATYGHHPAEEAPGESSSPRHVLISDAELPVQLQGPRPRSSGPDSLPPLDELARAISPEYADGSGSGKADEVPGTAFPDPPPASGEVGSWLAAHNEAFMGVLRGLYESSAISAFLVAEEERCRRFGPFCNAAFRQKAMSAIIQSLGRQGDDPR